MSVASTLRWKLLMAYLPGIATVVNSFDSPEVQQQVYRTLLHALDEKTLAEDGIAVSDLAKEAPIAKAADAAKSGAAAAPAAGASAGARGRPKAAVAKRPESSDEIAVDVVDGANIHAFLGQ